MIFKTYKQNDILNNTQLIDFIVNTICDNLEYLFGSNMRSNQNKNEWIEYNLKTVNPDWYCVIASNENILYGLLIFTYDKSNKRITINDIEIPKAYRHNITLIRGLFREALLRNDFRFIRGYINKNNYESQNNFLKYTTIINETRNGYIIETQEQNNERILRILKREL
ncbi:MAG: hypothetical protein RBR48_04965 [Bacilli bacterium]|nr:hypothetical protein [Bacilli bacterium]